MYNHVRDTQTHTSVICSLSLSLSLAPAFTSCNFVHEQKLESGERERKKRTFDSIESVENSSCNYFFSFSLQFDLKLPYLGSTMCTSCDQMQQKDLDHGRERERERNGEEGKEKRKLQSIVCESKVSLSQLNLLNVRTIEELNGRKRTHNDIRTLVYGKINRIT